MDDRHIISSRKFQPPPRCVGPPLIWTFDRTFLGSPHDLYKIVRQE
jgi:hypothetical protein